MKLNKSSYLTNTYVIFLFLICPLILKNKLFDVVETKFTYFALSTAITVILLIFLGGIKQLSFRINPTDIFILSFLAINFISSMLSGSFLECWSGNSDRMFGLYTIVIITFSYFIVTQFGQLNSTLIKAIVIGGLLVSILGILNYYFIDPFGIYTKMVTYMKSDYISTLGHRNIYASFFAFVMPCAFITYLYEKNKITKYIYLAISILIFAGCICGNSDSAIITIIISLLCIILLCKTQSMKIDLLLLIAGLLVTARILGLLYIACGSKRSIDSFTKFITTDNSPLLGLILIGLLIIYYRNRHRDFQIKRKYVYSFSAIILFAILITIFITQIANITLSDSWGSNRGYIWKRAIIIFTHKYTFKEVLLGCGPDNVLSVIENFYGNEIVALGYEHYNNVHNEYLQYLMTTGILGLISYLSILISTIYNFTKNKFNDPYTIAIFIGFICYALQAFVNVNQVVTTPLFFIFIALINVRNRDV